MVSLVRHTFVVLKCLFTFKLIMKKSTSRELLYNENEEQLFELIVFFGASWFKLFRESELNFKKLVITACLGADDE